MVTKTVVECDGPNCTKQWSKIPLALGDSQNLCITGFAASASKPMGDPPFLADFCSWRCLGRWLVDHCPSGVFELQQGISEQDKSYER